MAKVYVGDVGTVITLDTGVDISAATVREIKVSLPNGRSATWSAALSGTTAISFTTIANTLQLAGTYKLQAYVETPTWSGRGETVTLEVYAAFN